MKFYSRKKMDNKNMDIQYKYQNNTNTKCLKIDKNSQTQIEWRDVQTFNIT